MNSNNPLQKLGVSSLAMGAVFLLAQLKCDAAHAQQKGQEHSQSQQTPPPPSPAPPPSSQPSPDPAPAIGALPVKRRKVWTDDDVVDLRSPADAYRVEKEAKEAADAEAAAKEAAIRTAIKSEKEPPLDIKLPATPEETEKMLKDAQGDIQEETEVLAKLHKELLVTPAEQQADKEKEVDRLITSLEKLRREVKALQDHLQMLRGQPHEETPSAVPQPPGS